MTTRYYKVTCEEIIKEIALIFNKQIESIRIAEQFAKKHGLGSPSFKRWNMFDLFLDGFEMSRKEFDLNYRDGGLWCIPKNGTSAPRSRKSSKIHQDYKKLWSEVNVDDKHLHEVLGWNHLSFFPTSPGLHSRVDDDLAIFMMPDSCCELKGCIEISNIEYMNLTADKD